MPSVLTKHINRYYGLDFPEEFRFGINQHLKEEFSREKMFNRELSNNTTIPPVPNLKDVKIEQSKEVEKPSLPKINKVTLPQGREVEVKYIDVQNILNSKDKDSLFEAVSVELTKLTKTGIMFFVRGDILQSVSSTKPFGLIDLSIEDNSLFKKTVLNKDFYIGPPEESSIMNTLLAKLGTNPNSIVLLPILYDGMVFSVLYVEDLDNLSELTQIRDAVSSVFSRFIN